MMMFGQVEEHGPPALHGGDEEGGRDAGRPHSRSGQLPASKYHPVRKMFIGMGDGGSDQILVLVGTF